MSLPAYRLLLLVCAVWMLFREEIFNRVIDYTAIQNYLNDQTVNMSDEQRKEFLGYKVGKHMTRREYPEFYRELAFNMSTIFGDIDRPRMPSGYIGVSFLILFAFTFARHSRTFLILNVVFALFWTVAVTYNGIHSMPLVYQYMHINYEFFHPAWLYVELAIFLVATALLGYRLAHIPSEPVITEKDPLGVR